MARRGVGDHLREALQRSWWKPRRDGLALLLTPLSWLYRALAAWRSARQSIPWRAPCPVIVVGNLIVGGAGKTPAVIALVNALRTAGRRPGVISRGYGRTGTGVTAVQADSTGADVGDEPLLIQRASGVPVFVGAARVAAAQALLHAHPEVDLLIADDGLQHQALGRDAEVWVFDERGIGNGHLLPAGPLRQTLPATVPEDAVVLYNAPRPSTSLPGVVAGRSLRGACSLAQWHAGQPMTRQQLTDLAPKRQLAIAGIASPQRFFDMLRDAGLTIDTLALPDHARFDTLPWPAATADVICTEKDAVKLDPDRMGATRVWVVGLDLELPPALLAALQRHIAPNPP